MRSSGFHEPGFEMRAVNELLQWSPATATFYTMPASLFCSRSISAESNTVQTEKGLGAVSMEYCEVHRTCGTALNRPSLVVLRFAGMVELPAYDCHSKKLFDPPNASTMIRLSSRKPPTSDSPTQNWPRPRRNFLGCRPSHRLGKGREDTPSWK